MKKFILIVLTVLLGNTMIFAQNPTLKVGEKIPEISLNSPEGNPIALSSLKGKVVLVYFWSSYGRPNNIENPNVLSAYREFKDKQFKVGNGFTVYAVCIDRSEESWKNAILKDSLIWPSHVSDFKWFDSEAMILCKVDHLPANFLIDENGIILAIDLRRSALREKLLQLVKP